jgi:site-specific DNA recombinase
MTNTGRPLRTLVESFELALQYLSSPWNIRNNDQVAWQKTVLRLAFAEPIHYCRNQGVRTPNISFPFKVGGSFN